MKILVFGGSGFLGSHVCDNLILKKYKVTNFDKKKNIWSKPNLQFIEGDISEIEKIKKIIHNFDIVFNFAALSNLNQALKRPMEAIKTNLINHIDILLACKNAKIKKYIFASTLYVGGNYGGFYRCSKLAAEEFLKEFSRVYNTNFCILRYGTLYGPRSDKTNGIYDILSNAIRNKKIIYSGNKESQREYIHVVDAAKATVDVLNNEFNKKTIIITGRETTKVSDLLEIIREILNIKTKVKYRKKNYLKSKTHYVMSPYSIDNYIEKYSKDINIDLGQGLKNLIEDINANK
jgi:UDP-glucose 4-epimerase